MEAMEGPKFEKSPSSLKEQKQLLEARLENAKKAVEQADEEFLNAKTKDERQIWENRLKQRQENFNRIQDELRELEERVEIAA